MVTRTEVVTTDDLTGEPGAATREFGLNGKSYKIDLTKANSERLDAFLAPFVGAARQHKNGRPARSTTRKAKIANLVANGLKAAEAVAAVTEPANAGPRKGRAPLPAPPDRELLAVHAQVGTFGGVADHFKVSTVTATKWVKAAKARQ